MKAAAAAMKDRRCRGKVVENKSKEDTNRQYDKLIIIMPCCLLDHSLAMLSLHKLSVCDLERDRLAFRVVFSSSEASSSNLEQMEPGNFRVHHRTSKNR